MAKKASTKKKKKVVKDIVIPESPEVMKKQLTLDGIKPLMRGVKFTDSSIIKDNIWSGSGNESGTYSNKGLWAGFRVQFISAEELWATAKYTGKGHFIIFLTNKEALKGEWKHVKRNDSDQELNESTTNFIKKTDDDFIMRDKSEMVMNMACAMGQSAIVKTYPDPSHPGIGPLELRPVYYDENDLIFKNGILTHLMVYLRVGRVTKRVKFAIKDVVFYVNSPDPFGNKYIGMSCLNASYYSIKYLMNILEAYSNIILQRGLGLLDIEITGITDEAELTKYADQFGQPSQYSAIIHNERMKVNVSDGIKMGADIESVTSVYTREISSGSGIGEARLNGVQQGRVTGSETDQDNFASVQRVRQKTFMDAIVQTYQLAEPQLAKVPKWAIEFPIQIKFDKLKESQVRTTDAQTITALQEILTINHARKMLGLELKADAEGDMTVFEFIVKENKRLESIMPDHMKGGGGFGGDSPSNQHNTLDENNEAEKEAKKNTTRTKGDNIRPSKIIMASALLEKGTSQPNVNKILKDNFGSGLSFTDLTEIRKKLDKKKI